MSLIRTLAGMASSAGVQPPSLDPYAFIILTRDLGLEVLPRDAEVEAATNFRQWTTNDTQVSGWARAGGVGFTNASVYDTRLDSFAYRSASDIGGDHRVGVTCPPGDYIVDAAWGASSGDTSAFCSLFNGTGWLAGPMLPISGVQDRWRTVPVNRWCDMQMDADYTDADWLARDPSVRGEAITVTDHGGDTEQNGITIRWVPATDPGFAGNFMRICYVRIYSAS